MNNGFSKKAQSLQYIRVGDLTIVWPEAQRELSERNAKAIAENFDPDLFGTLNVSLVGNGKYHVNDGQTRAAAVRMLWGDNAVVPCVVVSATTAARAAHIFSKMNGGRAKPSAMDMFKRGVVAGYEVEVAVDGIVHQVGLRVDYSDADGCIRAPAALIAIYKQYGGDALKLTLLTIKEVWGLDRTAYDQSMMRGFAMFLAQPDAVIDPARLAKKLPRKFTPGRLLGSAKATREAFGGSMARAVCALVQETYQSGMRKVA